jgi:hypothetical protein
VGIREQSSAEQDLVTEVIREQEQAAGERGTFESHWQEIAARVFPDYFGAFTSNGYFTTPGSKRNMEIFDSTGAIALQQFGAVNESFLVPSTERWHGLIPPNAELKRDRATRIWMDDANDALFRYRYAPKANFTSQVQQHWLALGAFGTGSVFVDQLQGEPGLRYKHLHLGELYCFENHQGIVDKFIRKFQLTARQARQKWGADKLPQEILDKLDKNGEQKFFFLHCVKPREDLDSRRRDYKGMKYASYYVSITGRRLLGEGGYNVFPAPTSRHRQAPGEVYGRSPAMDVLPALKTLNEAWKVIMKQGHRAVDPIYLLADDGILDSFSAVNGAMVSGGVNSDGRPLVHTLPVGNVMIGKELMDDQRSVVRDVFYTTLFQILTETPQMTATEVLERVKEKGILLAPTMGRQQSEFLGPLIDRELDLLMRQGLLPPMPPALVEAKGEYHVRYDSPLSRMQKAQEMSGTQRHIQFTSEIFNVTQDPSLFDVYDFDTIQRDLAEGQAMPTRHLVSDEVVAARRAQRAQQVQDQADTQAAPGAAAMIKAAAVAKKSGVSAR